MSRNDYLTIKISAKNTPLVRYYDMSVALPATGRAQFIPTTDMICTSPFAPHWSHRRGSVHDRSVRLPSDSQAYYVNEATRDRHVNQERCPGVDY